MFTIFKKENICLVIIVFALSACSSGGDGDGDSGGVVDKLTVNLSASTTPAVRLSGILTMVEYDEVLEVEAEAKPAPVANKILAAPGDSQTLISLGGGGSNLLGIDESGNTVFPISNVETLIVDFQVLSPDQTQLYLAARVSGDRGFFGLFNNPSESLPIIGPKLQSTIPLYTSAALVAEYGPGAHFSPASSGQGIVIENASGIVGEIDPEVVVTEIETQLTSNGYMACQLLEYSRLSGETDCLGGIHIESINTNIFLFLDFNSYPISYDLPVSNILLTDKSYTDMSGVRPGLKPLQFDADGNRYVMGSLYNASSDEYGPEGIIKISPDNIANQVFSLDSIDVSKYLVLPNGDIAYSYNNLADFNDRGIKVFQNGNHLTISDKTNFQADTASTLIINYDLFPGFNYKLVVSRADGSGFNELPLSHNDRKLGNNPLILSDDGSLYGCVSKSDFPFRETVSLLPYRERPLFEGCDYGLIAQGHHVSAEEIPIGNLGATELIQVLRLSDGTIFEVFSSDDYANADRYNVNSLAYASNTIIFAADRTTTPTGAVIGEIDVSKLSQGKTEAEYLTLHEVGSSVAASNSVRDITPLPIIEPTGTAAAPKITDVPFNAHEHSQIGLEFSEFMNKASVGNALSLEENSNPVEFIPFWIYKNLFLLADTDGFGDANGDNIIDKEDYQAYQHSIPYDLNIDPNIAMDIAGRLMNTATNPNTSHQFSFMDRAAFYATTGQSLSDFDQQSFASGKFARLRDARCNACIIDAEEAWQTGMDGIKNYWGMYHGDRYFKLVDIPLNAAALSHRVEFDFSSNDFGDQFGLAIKNSSHVNSASGNSSNIRQLTWLYNADTEINPIDSSLPQVNSPATGFFIIPSTNNGRIETYNLPDTSSNHIKMASWARYRVDMIGGQIEISILNPATNLFELITSTDQPILANGDTAEFWFMLQLSPYEIDNIRLVNLINASTEGNVIAETDFEDEDDPFGAFNSLQTMGTKDFAPVSW